MTKFVDLRKFADLILRIEYHDVEKRLAFQLSDLDGDRRTPVWTSRTLKKDPATYCADLYRKIKEQDRAAGASRSFKDSDLQSVGAALVRRLLPEELHPHLAAPPSDRTLLVVSNEPWIPWEILWFEGDGDGGFLAERFAMARWRYDLRREVNLSLERTVLVIPRIGAHRSGEEEAARLGKVFGRLKTERVEASKDALADSIRRSWDCWHFAGSVYSKSDQPDHSGLILQDGKKLDAIDLRRILRFQSSRPLVFLNGCRTGLTDFSITGFGGLADAFLEAEAGAVVATHWEVDGPSAVTFSEAFYRSLLSGRSLAFAVQDARKETRTEHPYSSAWLAYAVFGQPLAALRAEPVPNPEPMPSPGFFRDSSVKALTWAIPAAAAVFSSLLTLKAWKSSRRELLQDSQNRIAAALAQIDQEISDNYTHATSLIMALLNSPPEPFIRPRRVDERELVYQDRARNSARDYRDHIGRYLDAFPFSNAVLRSYEREIATIDADRKAAIDLVYRRLEDVREMVKSYQEGLLHTIELGVSDAERVARDESLYLEKVVEVKIAILQAAAASCMLAEGPEELEALQFSLGFAGLAPALAPGLEGHCRCLQEASDLSSKKADILAGRLGPGGFIHLPNDLPPPEAEFPGDLSLPDLEGKDAAELLSLATESYWLSDGRSALACLDKALEHPDLSPMQHLYVEASADRLRNPEPFGETPGVIVLEVSSGGEFERAGFQAGDVVLTMDGEVLKSADDLSRNLIGSEEYVLVVLRDGRRIKLFVRGGRSAGAILSPLITLDPRML